MLSDAGVAAAAAAAFSAALLLAIAAWRAALPKADAAAAPGLAASTVAFAHGVVILTLSTRTLAPGGPLTDFRWTDFAAPNTPAQHFALAISLGYFIADTFAYLLPYDRDIPFLAHHAISAAFLGAALGLRQAGAATLFGMWIGEVTNPFFHFYNGLDLLRRTNARAAALFPLWGVPFCIVFISVRTLAGPLISYWWCPKVWALPAPAWARVLWVLTSVGITLVSQTFSLQFVRDVSAAWGARRTKRRTAVELKAR